MSALKVTIKNPYIPSYIFTTKNLSPDCSVRVVKKCVSQEFLSSPSVEDQRLIYFGRILKDAQKLEDLHSGGSPTGGLSSKELIFHISLKKASLAKFRAHAKKKEVEEKEEVKQESATSTETASSVSVPHNLINNGSNGGGFPIPSPPPPPHMGAFYNMPGGFSPMTPMSPMMPMFIPPYHSPYFNSPYASPGLQTPPPPPHGVAPFPFLNGMPPNHTPPPPNAFPHTVAPTNVPAQFYHHGQTPPVAGGVAIGYQQQLGQYQHQQQQQQELRDPPAHPPLNNVQPVVADRPQRVDPLIRYLNFGLAAKLFLMAMIFSQGEAWTSFRTLIMIVLALTSYAHQVGLLKDIFRKCKRNNNNRRAPENDVAPPPNIDVADGEEPEEKNEDDVSDAAPPPRTGLLVNIEKFVLGLFASLFPEWQHRHVE